MGIAVEWSIEIFFVLMAISSWIRLNATIIISISTIIISISTIIISKTSLNLSIYHSKKIREHYRLSVKPDLCFDNCEQSIDGLTMGVMLKNSGIGPAIITKYKLKWNEEQEYEGLRDIYIFLNSKLGPQNKFKINYVVPNPPCTIAINGEFWLFGLKDEFKTEENTKLFGNFLYSIDIFLEYESMYGEKFKYSWRE